MPFLYLSISQRAISHRGCLFLVIPVLLTALSLLAVPVAAQENGWQEVEPRQPDGLTLDQAADEPEEQEEDGQHLLSMEPALTGVGGPAFKFSGVVDQSGFLLGGRGGLSIDNRLLVGGAAYGMVSSIEPPDDGDRNVGMGYGGLLVEFTVAPDRMFNITFGSIIGAGRVNHLEPANQIQDTRSQGFFLLEPEVNVGVNLAPFVRFSLGLGYRFASGMADDAAVTDSDIRDFSLGAQLQFGDF